MLLRLSKSGPATTLYKKKNKVEVWFLLHGSYKYLHTTYITYVDRSVVYTVFQAYFSSKSSFAFVSTTQLLSARFQTL